MGNILKIARRDILGFLVAPKAAVVFWFFLMFLGLFFYFFMVSFLQMQQQASMLQGQLPTLEQLLQALFQNMHFLLLLAIPAVCMGCLAEEKKTQTIKLLQSSPVSSLQIVLGKYLALVTVMGLALLASVVFPLFLLRYGNPDPGVVLSSYLGAFLLICSQLAFGLWISSMTKSQIMAFLFTMFGLFLLLIINWMAPNLGSATGAEAFARYLASTTHYENFLKGMLSVADVTYFILFAVTFLFFTHIVLDSQRWR